MAQATLSRRRRLSSVDSWDWTSKSWKIWRKMPVSATEVSGDWPPAFWTRWPVSGLPPTATDCAMTTASSRRESATDGRSDCHYLCIYLFVCLFITYLIFCNSRRACSVAGPRQSADRPQTAGIELNLKWIRIAYCHEFLKSSLIRCRRRQSGRTAYRP